MGKLKLTGRNKKFQQGYYKPKNTEKYIGNGPVVFRSGLELKFMRWADNNPNVLEWNSEEIAIPYWDSLQRKQRRYFVDAYVKILEGENVKKYLVEIKPFKQTQEPKSGKGKKKSNLLYEKIMWQNNTDKWNQAREFAKKHGMEFIIITEKELN